MLSGPLARPSVGKHRGRLIAKLDSSARFPALCASGYLLISCIVSHRAGAILPRLDGRPIRDAKVKAQPVFAAGSTAPTMPGTIGIHGRRLGRRGKAVGLWTAGGFAV